MVISIITISVLWRYVIGDFENDNNFNRYDIQVVKDSETGCEYLKHYNYRNGNLIPRYEDNGKIKGCEF